MILLLGKNDAVKRYAKEFSYRGIVEKAIDIVDDVKNC